MKKLFFCAASGIILFTVSCKKESATPQPSRVYFPEVRTIIQSHCISCHYPGGQGMPVILTADSDIVNYAAAIKAATLDPVTPQNRRMPLEGSLTDAEKTTISNWFAAGGGANN